MKALLALAALLWACAAPAQDMTVGVHVATYHPTGRADGSWNSFNPGVYIRKDHIVVGAYYNSEFRTSVYAAGVVERPISDRVNLAATLGAVTGYGKPVQPLFLGSVSYRFNDSDSVRLSWAPKAHPKGSAIFHFSIERRFP